MDYKYIYLGDPIYFSLQIGKRITKGELFNSKKANIQYIVPMSIKNSDGVLTY